MLLRMSLMFFSAILAWACSGSDDTALSADIAGGGDVPVTLCIQLDTPSGDAHTRADILTYDPGTTVLYESYIDIDHTHILLFDGDNKYIASFVPDEIIPVDGGYFNSRRYELKGTISKKPGNTQLKVMMLANWPNSPENLEEGKTTIDDVCSSDEYGRYAYDYAGKAPFVPSGQTPIPMYGINTADIESFVPDRYNDLGTLHLLRAMAKVEVKMKGLENDKGRKMWTLKTVTLTRHSVGGYCAPTSAYDEADYAANYHVRSDVPVHIPADVISDIELPFKPQPVANEDGTTSYIIYIPEYRNTAADGKTKAADAAEINLEFNEKADQTYTVEFKYYDNVPQGSASGDAFDIKRDNYYKFVIEKEEETTDVVCHIDIQPYAECRITMDYGLMRDENGDLMIIPNAEKDKDGNYVFPKYFTDYMAGKTWPSDENGNKLQMAEGDYYAIILGTEGWNNAEVWLKDRDGCQVISNYAKWNPNDAECNARHVVYYFGTTREEYLKDIENDRRLQHNTDHSSVVLDPEGRMIYKRLSNHTLGAIRLPVESWDEKTGLFWVEYTDKYVEMDNTGGTTGKVQEK